MVYLAFSSIDRSSGSDDNFVSLSDQNLFRYSKVRLHQVNMINGLYNVTATNYGFSFAVRDNAVDTDYNVTIPVGSYTILTLMAALKTAMDLATGEVFTVSQAALTSRVTISIAGPSEFKIYGMEGKLNLMLGFSQGVDTAFGLSITAGRIFNVNRYVNLYLLTNIIRDRSWLSAAQKLAPVFGSIPIGSVNYLQTLSYYPGDVTFINLQSNEINNVNFQLVDDQNEPVDLNGLYVTIVVEAI